MGHRGITTAILTHKLCRKKKHFKHGKPIQAYISFRYNFVLKRRSGVNGLLMEKAALPAKLVDKNLRQYLKGK